MKCLKVLLVLLAALCVSAPVFAETADSSTWLYQQNGSLAANPDFNVSGMTDAGGGILDFVAASSMDSPTWVSQSANLISAGYTIETRVKVTATGTDGYGFGFMPADGAKVGWFGVRTYDVFTQYADGTSGVASWGGGTNSDDFHVLRIAHAPSATQLSIWKDGVLLTSTANLYAPAYTPQFLSIGNISASGGTGQLDYVRWTTGAYAPVPEPSALVLACVGLVGLLAYAWRRRR